MFLAAEARGALEARVDDAAHADVVADAELGHRGSDLLRLGSNRMSGQQERTQTALTMATPASSCPGTHGHVAGLTALR